MDPRYLQYFRLLQEEEFFEAHEILEGLWRETKGREREFYHGLIQLAAALVHFQRGNLTGAKELFQTASGYLKSYLPHYQGVNLSKALEDFKHFLKIWAENPEGPSGAKKFLPRITLDKSYDA